MSFKDLTAQAAAAKKPSPAETAKTAKTPDEATAPKAAGKDQPAKSGNT